MTFLNLWSDCNMQPGRRSISWGARGGKANVFRVTAVSWAPCWLQYSHHLFDPHENCEIVWQIGAEAQSLPVMLSCLRTAIAVLGEYALRSCSVLQEDQCTLPDVHTTLSTLGQHGLPHFWAFKNQPQANFSSVNLSFLVFIHFCHLRAQVQKYKHNLYCSWVRPISSLHPATFKSLHVMCRGAGANPQKT